MLRQVGGWAEALRDADVTARRDVLADLIERVTPERVAYGKFEVRIEWTALGRALHELADAAVPSSAA